MEPILSWKRTTKIADRTKNVTNVTHTQKKTKTDELKQLKRTLSLELETHLSQFKAALCPSHSQKRNYQGQYIYYIRSSTSNI